MGTKSEKDKKIISSIAPSAYHSIPEMMREVLRLHDIDVGTAKPAIVESYDRKSATAQVRILIQDVFASQDGDVYKNVAPVIVPVLREQHGMFLVDAPLYPGDTGYVIAGHRDGSLAVEGNSNPVLEPKKDRLGNVIDSRTNNKGPQPPNTYLLHRYENGFFVPCRWGDIEIDEKDKDSLIVARLSEKVTTKQDTKTPIGKEAEQGYKKENLRFNTDGCEGKVALDKDGTVRVKNGTGAVIESDEYREAQEGEEPDLVTEDGRRLKRKPKATIDPTADLDKTDAKFREVVAVEQVLDEEEGKVKYRYRKYRVLADEGTADVAGLGAVGGGADSFFAIYRREDGTFGIRKGMVCADCDQMLEVAEPEDALDPEMSYFCVARMSGASGVLEKAEIVGFEKGKEAEGIAAYNPTEIETYRRWFVPIGSVDADGVVTQLHQGAITLTSVNLEAGDGIELTYENGVFKVGNSGVLKLEAGSNVTIEPLTDESGKPVKGGFRISATGGAAGVTTLRGETDGSATISGDVKVSGQLDDADDKTSCGIEFETIAQQQPGMLARLIAKIKGRPTAESGWGCKNLKILDKDGTVKKTVHFLGNDDAEVKEGGGGDVSNVIGSDYIDVSDETDAQGQKTGKRKVEAKIETPDPQGDVKEPNALLTHNTNQFVRCVKTFLGLGSSLASALKRVVIDGPNGKIEAIAPSGGEEYKIVIDAGELANAAPACGKKEIHVKKLTVTHPRAKTVDGKQVTSETYHILGCDDIDIQEGDAIEKIESGTPTQSGGFTLTPVTITLKDGTSLPAFNISAKNGADGDKGDDGASVIGATAGTPIVSGNTTMTPITFTLSDGSTVGPVNVVSTNGVEASGSDYIDVGDGTGGTTKGQVKAKVPDSGKGLVTLDTDQTISGVKTFSSQVKVSNSRGTAYYYSNAIYLKAANGTPWIAFYDSPDASSNIAQIKLTSDKTLDVNAEEGVKISASVNKATLDNNPTVGTGDASTKAIATTAWTNNNYKVAELVQGSNIKLTPDANDPKKITVSATGSASLDHSFSWEGEKKADIAASADIAVDSKTIQGSEGISVTETNRVITISGRALQVSGYTTPAGTWDYEVTGQEWDSTNHRIVIHKVKKIYENGLLKTREAVADEYIQFVEETV